VISGMNTVDFESTRKMILLRVLLVPFIAVILVSGTLVYHFSLNLSRQTQARLSFLAEGHRNLIEQFLRERSADLKYVAASSSLGELSANSNLARELERLQTVSLAFLDLGVFDAEGNHVAYVGPYDLKGKNYAHTEWFKRVQNESMYISDVFLGYRNIPHFIIAVRQFDGDRPWYIRATIDTFFFNNLVENIRVGKTGEAYLVNKTGVFQTRRRSGGNLMEDDPDFVMYQIGSDTTTSFAADDLAGERHLYAISKLEPTDWLLVVRQQLNEAYAPLLRAVLIAVAMIIAGGIAVVSMGFFLATGVAHQLTVADMEKRQMGSQLIMAGKLAEVGEMSAGVAHEINNPLQVMKSEEMLMKDILSDIEAAASPDQMENIKMLHGSIDQMGTQIDRCGRITQGLLKFARESETHIQGVDLKELLPEVIALVDRRAKVENINIIEEIQPGLPPVPSDPSQLQQVFLNLLNNAMYAVNKNADGGEIKILAKKEDSNLMISVQDNGCGIPPEQIGKIFLPFFTTKPVGQGTGLGLSTCYGIIERLGGDISVASEVNVGTTFTIRLPINGPPEKIRSWLTVHEQGGIRK
jgi:two-component system NtrC family sensor kinase